MFTAQISWISYLFFISFLKLIFSYFENKRTVNWSKEFVNFYHKFRGSVRYNQSKYSTWDIDLIIGYYLYIIIGNFWSRKSAKCQIVVVCGKVYSRRKWISACERNCINQYVSVRVLEDLFESKRKFLSWLNGNFV